MGAELLSLKKNYCFQDLVLEEAIRCEAEATTEEEKKKANTLLEKAIKNKWKAIHREICAESVADFLNEFEPFMELIRYNDSVTVTYNSSGIRIPARSRRVFTRSFNYDVRLAQYNKNKRRIARRKRWLSKQKEEENK